MEAIETWLGDVEEQSRRLGRPVVTLAYAQSLDGCLALRAGHPTALSGPESQILTHRLRAAHQGILVGVGTVLSDDPLLNVRLVERPDPRPVVLDSFLRLPDKSKLLDRKENLPWIVCGAAAGQNRRIRLEQRGARVIQAATDAAGWIDLQDMLKQLYNLGMRSLMVEGGARILASFLVRRFVDRVVVTIAPVYLGGLHLIVNPLLGVDGEAPGLRDPVYQTLGRDLIVWGKIEEQKL